MSNIQQTAKNKLSKTKLLDEVRNVIRLRHYSRRTEESYVNWIRRYILFHNKKHPRDLDEKEIRNYLNYLSLPQNVSYSTQLTFYHSFNFHKLMMFIPKDLNGEQTQDLKILTKIAKYSVSFSTPFLDLMTSVTAARTAST